eukprot:bmy_22370T0
MEAKAPMQMLTKCYCRNCLLTVMDQYSAMVCNMKQLAVCVDVEHGLLPWEEWKAKVAGGKADEAEDEAAETEEAEEERVLGQLDLEA